ncbi:phosphotransferase family protein [Paenibacillus sp. N3/727]|uniref:aminoglycoside phosphotransferase family protein n=1 Tax=Paenibacillus sp. N3/727 TaxID=2925845 RepID=UPI001F532DE4|nr:phosphotransferase family protein [Paenibacillus sp. N3/727]UNK17177.1 phosphotransferase family protein [Paenibacillus sp. N3/727]
MNHIFNGIPDSHTWIKAEAINKGWSNDKKYYIQEADGGERLLRMSDISQYDKKKWELESLKQLRHIDVLMSHPIDFGVCNDGQSVYSLLTWIEGEDAIATLPLLSAKDQYMLGVRSGEFLRKMHQIPAENNHTPWVEYYNQKIDKYIANYRACGIHLEGDDIIINYVEQNRYLLDDRPSTFQHGDYHVGNMVITPTGELGIIDFNRLDYGDPWEEFNRITFDASLSGYFASGRVNGYFNDDVPEAFFRLMALYIASNQLSSIHWAIPFGEEEVEFMLKRAEEVMDWYDGFQQHVPNWYISNYAE